MTLTKHINKIMEVIFVIALSLICLFISQKSPIFIGVIPITFALFYFNEGTLSYLLGAFGTYFVGLIFASREDLFTSLIPLLLIGLSLIILVSLKFSARVEIITTFIITSLIFIFIYKYTMLVDGLDINSLALNLKENFEEIYSYDLDLDIYRLTASLYPAIIGWVSMLYSVISIKIIRNYLANKSEAYTDIKNLDELRMSAKDLLIILAVSLVIFYLGKSFGIKDLYLVGNLLLIIIMFFAINGASLLDFMLKKSSLPLTRAFQWFFMLILIQILLIPLIILGIADVFIDFRARRKNEK